MSDLYHETAQARTAETGTSRQQTQDRSLRQPDKAARSDEQGHSEYGTSADVRAMIAAQNELPSPAESRARTWGDNPEYYDDNDLASEHYDGDFGDFTWEDDNLPSPAESRARTWGDNPQFYDEADLDSEYGADLGIVIAGEGDQAAGRDAVSAEAPDANADRPDPPAPRDRGDGDVCVSSAEADWVKEPEGEQDAASRRIADLEAELKAVKEDQAAQRDRIEQQLARADQQTGNADDSAAGNPDGWGGNQVNTSQGVGDQPDDPDDENSPQDQPPHKQAVISAAPKTTSRVIPVRGRQTLARPRNSASAVGRLKVMSAPGISQATRNWHRLSSSGSGFSKRRTRTPVRRSRN